MAQSLARPAAPRRRGGALKLRAERPTQEATRNGSPADRSGRARRSRLARAIDRLGRLPVLSATVRRVRALADSDESGVGDMVAALEADQGLATDLLRYANSAANARPLRARSIRAAVTLVGRKAIAQLALEAATFGFFERAPGNGGRSVGQLHLHAAAVAAGSHAMADGAFTCGAPATHP